MLVQIAESVAVIAVVVLVPVMLVLAEALTAPLARVQQPSVERQVHS